MACNNGVQISLDDDCTMDIAPNMMVKQLLYGNDSYDVEAKLPNGTALPQYTVGFDASSRPIRRVSINRSHIGLLLEVRVTLRGCANSCWGSAKIEDKLAPVIATCPCEERITRLDGNISSSADPSYSRPNDVANCPTTTPAVAGVFYETRTFALDSAGIVDISTVSPSVRFALYTGTFNPAAPCTGLVVSNVTNYSAMLLAAVNYTLVISSVANSTPSDGIDFTLYINNRSGNVKSSTSASVCTRTCNQESALLSETAINAPDRPKFTDNCSGALWIPTTTLGGTINFNSTSIVLNGGTLAPSTPIETTAKICFTTPVSQTFTFDWTAAIIPNTATDPAFFTINGGAPTYLSNAALSGQNINIVLTLGDVLCFEVGSNNSGASNTLTLTNIRLSKVFPELVYTKFDSTTLLQCSDAYAKIVRRRWTATDPSGNVSAIKTQFFYIKRLTLADVKCPEDWIKECGTSYATLPNGAPTPAVSGQPDIVGCQNVQVYYDDVVFKLCGPGIKVFRQWTIIDWCSGDEKTCAQTIKVEDHFAPLIDVAQPFNSPICFFVAGELGALGSPKPSVAIVGTDANTCLGKPWTVATPSLLSDACSPSSKLSWYVKFKKSDGSCFDPDESQPFITADATTAVTGTPGTSNYRIVGLPLGRTWIRYYAYDECGNERTVTVELDVVDNTPPTAICEDETVISIDDTGWGVLLATSLDDHSIDNCGSITKYEVRRKTSTCPGYATDLNFGPSVRFCCADVTAVASYIPVVLRVYDAAGNFNECETTVKVQNKRPPAISCPAPVQLICGDSRITDFVNGALTNDPSFGIPTLSGACNDTRFESKIKSTNINPKCGTGTITKTWSSVSNPAVSCDQVLTVVSPAFSSSSVVFPNDTVIATCDLTKVTPDVLNSKPVVDKLSCRDVGISFTDQTFDNVAGACIKILRTWRVIDWCSYATNGVIAEKVQTIKLTGSGGAVFTGCTNQSINADPGACDKVVTLTANATDACTNPLDLVYTWSLDLGKNGSIDVSGSGKSFTRTLPAGTHRVTFTVVNKCGTPSSCSYDVTIISNKKPTPVCLREVVWVMGSTKSTVVWASDFNLKSENNCGSGRLTYSFTTNRADSSRTFTCADIPNGQVATIPLKMYVFDTNGNFDFCDVNLILQDSPLTNACTDIPGLLPTVSGKIVTEAKEGVSEIMVELTNMNKNSEIQDMTKT
ncbi:MAG: hypothetical protein WAU01_00600, partial [Saprospiraceae bacterium]